MGCFLWWGEVPYRRSTSAAGKAGSADPHSPAGALGQRLLLPPSGRVRATGEIKATRRFLPIKVCWLNRIAGLLALDPHHSLHPTVMPSEMVWGKRSLLDWSEGRNVAPSTDPETTWKVSSWRAGQHQVYSCILSPWNSVQHKVDTQETG